MISVPTIFDFDQGNRKLDALAASRRLGQSMRDLIAALPSRVIIFDWE
jgi:hypothetical protein